MSHIHIVSKTAALPRPIIDNKVAVPADKEEGNGANAMWVPDGEEDWGSCCYSKKETETR